MGLYADLTDEQKSDIAKYDIYLRGLFSSLSKTRKDADADSWNQFATDNVDAILASLDAGETIPTETGLGGAKALTKEEFLTLQGIARTLKSTAETNQGLITKAIGVNA